MENENSMFYQQVQEAERYNKTLPDSIKFPSITKKTYNKEFYTSRFLPTKEITRLLNSKEISEQIYLKETSDLQSLMIDFSTLSVNNNNNTSEIVLLESEEIAPIEIKEEQQSQIQQPPK